MSDTVASPRSTAANITWEFTKMIFAGLMFAAMYLPTQFPDYWKTNAQNGAILTASRAGMQPAAPGTTRIAANGGLDAKPSEKRL